MLAHARIEVKPAHETEMSSPGPDSTLDPPQGTFIPTFGSACLRNLGNPGGLNQLGKLRSLAKILEVKERLRQARSQFGRTPVERKR